MCVDRGWVTQKSRVTGWLIGDGLHREVGSGVIWLVDRR